MKYLVILDDEIDFVLEQRQHDLSDICVDTWVETPNWTRLNSESEADARKIIEGMRPKK